MKDKLVSYHCYNNADSKIIFSLLLKKFLSSNNGLCYIYLLLHYTPLVPLVIL